MKPQSHNLKTDSGHPVIEYRMPGDGRIPARETPQTLLRSRIIQLKERSYTMLKKDLILRNPLRLMGRNT